MDAHEKPTVISRACYSSLVERLPDSLCDTPDLEPLSKEFGCDGSDA